MFFYFILLGILLHDLKYFLQYTLKIFAPNIVLIFKNCQKYWVLAGVVNILLS